MIKLSCQLSLFYPTTLKTKGRLLALLPSLIPSRLGKSLERLQFDSRTSCKNIQWHVCQTPNKISWTKNRFIENENATYNYFLISFSLFCQKFQHMKLVFVLVHEVSVYQYCSSFDLSSLKIWTLMYLVVSPPIKKI